MNVKLPLAGLLALAAACSPVPEQDRGTGLARGFAALDAEIQQPLESARLRWERAAGINLLPTADPVPVTLHDEVWETGLTGVYTSDDGEIREWTDFDAYRVVAELPAEARPLNGATWQITRKGQPATTGRLFIARNSTAPLDLTLMHEMAHAMGVSEHTPGDGHITGRWLYGHETIDAQDLTAVCSVADCGAFQPEPPAPEQKRATAKTTRCRHTRTH